MELSRVVHDEFIQYQIDDPAERHLREVMHAAEVVHSGNGDANGATGPATPPDKSSEHTPLLVKSPRGNHIIDLDKVEQILTREEAVAIEEDAKLPTWMIVREEAVVMTKLGVPMVRACRCIHYQWCHCIRMNRSPLPLRLFLT